MAECTANAQAPAAVDCLAHGSIVRCILVAVLWLAPATTQQLSWALSSASASCPAQPAAAPTALQGTTLAYLLLRSCTLKNLAGYPQCLARKILCDTLCTAPHGTGLSAPHTSEGLRLSCLRYHLSVKASQSDVARLWRLWIVLDAASFSILRCYGYACMMLLLKAREVNIDTATPAIAQLAC